MYKQLQPENEIKQVYAFSNLIILSFFNVQHGSTLRHLFLHMNNLTTLNDTIHYQTAL